MNVTFLFLCRDSFLGPTCFLLFTWSLDTHVGLRDLNLGGFICRFVCSPTHSRDEATVLTCWFIDFLGVFTKGNDGLLWFILNLATAFHPGERAHCFFAPGRTRLHRIEPARPFDENRNLKKSPNPPWKHHRRKDGGGDEPINNWSQPQPSS